MPYLVALWIPPIFRILLDGMTDHPRRHLAWFLPGLSLLFARCLPQSGSDKLCWWCRESKYQWIKELFLFVLSPCSHFCYMFITVWLGKQAYLDFMDSGWGSFCLYVPMIIKARKRGYVEITHLLLNLLLGRDMCLSDHILFVSVSHIATANFRKGEGQS